MSTLKALGWNPRDQGRTIYTTQGTINKEAGTLTTAGNANRLTNEIKQAYSGQVLVATAKKYGWTVKSTGNHQYEVTKRTL